MFGHIRSGQAVEAVTLANRNGVRATILTFGATLQSFVMPSERGPIDIILGHDDLAPYEQDPSYLATTVGRFANRIAEGRFWLDGQPHQLDCNDGPHHLHGGESGLDRRLWTLEAVGDAMVELSLISPDGAGGYPGELTVRVIWRLDDSDTLSITFQATTTRPTIVNLTNHAFFNLCGPDASAGEQLLTVFADAYTPTDDGLIPTGEIVTVAGTPFDFRSPRRIADRLRDMTDDQLRIGRGYDHNFVLRGERGVMKPAARLEDPATGRRLDVLTTEPGLQFYSGNFLDGRRIGKGGRAMRQGDGVCLEPQTFPNAPNTPGFPSARLEPGQTYHHALAFRLSTSR